MTWGVFAINWMDLGDQVKADDLFNRSYASYVREPFKIWTEVQSGVGAVNFVTGAGGFLQAVLSGYGGIRVKPEALEFNFPGYLPPSVDVMDFDGIQYLGNKFQFRYLASGYVDVTCTDAVGNAEILEIEYFDSVKVDVICNSQLLASRNVTFKIQSKTPSSCPPPLDRVEVDYS